MYKKTGESAHYLKRTGSYSTVPHRNGRVDVLPAPRRRSIRKASKIEELRVRADRVTKEKDEIEKQLHYFTRVDLWRARVGSAGTVELAALIAERDRLAAESRWLRRRMLALQ